MNTNIEIEKIARMSETATHIIWTYNDGNGYMSIPKSKLETKKETWIGGRDYVYREEDF